jgi:hypothetical protein
MSKFYQNLKLFWIEGWFRKASIDQKLKYWFNGRVLAVKMQHGRTYGDFPNHIQIFDLEDKVAPREGE